MAEFVQIMKDWRRMCMAMEKLRPDDPCAGCRLKGYGCPAIYEDNSNVDYADVEKNVTAWAAEHQEPVYPTWFEYVWSQLAKKEPISDHDLATWMENNRIPADIAQKLGIEPEEDKPKKRTKDMVCGNDYCELE